MEGSSRSHMFFEIVVLKNFVNFTGKHLCWSLFLTQFFTNFIKNTPTQVFSCEICKNFKNTFFLQNTSSGCFCQKRLQCRCLPVELAKFLSTLFMAEQFRCLLLNGHFSLEGSRNNKNQHDFWLISCVFYRYFRFPYSFPRNSRGGKALSFWL